MRLGLQIEPQFGYSHEEIRDLALAAERAGFYSLSVSDHLFFDQASERRECLEAWTLLSALAIVTDKLRLGPLVSCNSYRHPGLLAKMAASLDQLSAGRLQFAIGAGWKEIEYRAYGFPFPPGAKRIAELGEAIRILKLLWSKERATFLGEHYRIEDALCSPKPRQQPLKICVGGSGEKRLLRLVAEQADGWNMLPGVGPKKLSRKVEVLRRHCDDIERDFDEIEKSLFITSAIVDSDEELDRLEEDLKRSLGPRAASMLRAARSVGTAGRGLEVAETIESFRELGFEHVIALFPYRHEKEMLARFSEAMDV